MNYIKTLQAKVEALDRWRCDAWNEMDEFEAYLQGPKFQGPCNDYVHNHEIIALLRRVSAALCGEKDSERETDNGE